MKKRKRTLIIIGFVALFAVGYLFSSLALQKLVSDSEFSYYEQVAKDVYEQGSSTIYEVPETVTLEKTDTEIIISSADINKRGKVCATVQNGELVFERDNETGDAIGLSIAFGIIFVLIGLIIYIIPTPGRVLNKK